MKQSKKAYHKTIKWYEERGLFMFWTGIIIGIFIGAALGILIMSIAISAARNSPEEHNRYSYGTEASEELSPYLKNNSQIEENKGDK